MKPGLSLFLKNNFELSPYWYKKLLQIVKSDNPYLADTYCAVGCVYQKMNDFNEALEYYNHAIIIWKRTYGTNEPLLMAEC